MLDKNTRQLSPLYAHLLYLLMAAGIALQSPVFAVLFGRDYTQGEYYIFTIAVEVLLIGLPALVLIARSGLSYDLFARPPKAYQLLLLVPLVLFGIMAVTCVTALLTMMLTAMGASPNAPSPPLPEGNDFIGILRMLTAVSFIPALTEEIAFRGFIFKAYAPYGRVFAALLSGLLFALLHGSPLALPGHLILGIVLGLLMFWTGSIWVPIIYHFLHNALSTLISLEIGRMGTAKPSVLPINASAAMTLIVGAAFALSVYAGLLALFYSFSRKREAIAPLSGRLKMPLIWMLPLIPAFGLILYQYMRLALSMFDPK